MEGHSRPHIQKGPLMWKRISSGVEVSLQWLVKPMVGISSWLYNRDLEWLRWAYLHDGNHYALQSRVLSSPRKSEPAAKHLLRPPWRLSGKKKKKNLRTEMKISTQTPDVSRTKPARNTS